VNNLETHLQWQSRQPASGKLPPFAFFLFRSTVVYRLTSAIPFAQIVFSSEQQNDKERNGG